MNLKTGLNRLAREIEHGIWQQKYGDLLKLKNYDAGYRIIIAK